MKCPQCKGVMQKVKRSDVTVDSCGLCYGIWLDKGELEKIVSYKNAAPDTAINTLQSLLKQERTLIEKQSLSCPCCDLPMDKVSFNAAEAIIADYCPHCEGLWFDKGELIAVTDTVDNKPAPEKPKSSLFSSFVMLFLSGAILIALILWALQYSQK
ncbi:MAG: zf-TFIIB domain-containing protein [Candidatus Omnitrophica bacterium]|nr:zf-TFIIB domain-containing protein [Candidatus Omnitrophota bacterium]